MKPVAVSQVLDLTSSNSVPNTIEQSLKTALSHHIIKEVDIPLAAMTGVGVYKAAFNQNIHPEQIYKAIENGIKAIPQAKEVAGARYSTPNQQAYILGQQISLAALNSLPSMQHDNRQILKNQLQTAMTMFTSIADNPTYTNAALTGNGMFDFFTNSSSTTSPGEYSPLGNVGPEPPPQPSFWQKIPDILTGVASSASSAASKAADFGSKWGSTIASTAANLGKFMVSPLFEPTVMPQATYNAINSQWQGAVKRLNEVKDGLGDMFSKSMFMKDGQLVMPESIKKFQDAQKYSTTTPLALAAQVALASVPVWLPGTINRVKKWYKGRDLTKAERDHTEHVSNIVSKVTNAAIPLYNIVKTGKAAKLYQEAVNQNRLEVQNLQDLKNAFDVQVAYERSGYFQPVTQMVDEKRSHVPNVLSELAGTKAISSLMRELDPNIYKLPPIIDLFTPAKGVVDNITADRRAEKARIESEEKEKSERARQLVKEMMDREREDEKERRERSAITNVLPAGQKRTLTEGAAPYANPYIVKNLVATRPIAGIKRPPVVTYDDMLPLMNHIQQSKKRAKHMVRSKHVKGSGETYAHPVIDVSAFAKKVEEEGNARREAFKNATLKALKYGAAAVASYVTKNPSILVSTLASDISPDLGRVWDKYEQNQNAIAKEQRKLDAQSASNMQKLIAGITERLARADGVISDGDIALLRGIQGIDVADLLRRAEARRAEQARQNDNQLQAPAAAAAAPAAPHIAVAPHIAAAAAAGYF